MNVANSLAMLRKMVYQIDKKFSRLISRAINNTCITTYFLPISSEYWMRRGSQKNNSQKYRGYPWASFVI